MARSLRNKPNTEHVSITYPFGRIKDDDGTGLVGTPVNENVYGDFHQFFAKLLDEAGFSPNELPENEYDGFQFINALKTLIKGLDSWHNITLSNSWTNYFGSAIGLAAGYKTDNSGKVHLTGAITKTNPTLSDIQQNFGAAGAVPTLTNSRSIYFDVPCLLSTGVIIGTAQIAIGSDGSIGVKSLIVGTSNNSSPTFNPNSVTGDLIIPLDQISYFRD